MSIRALKYAPFRLVRHTGVSDFPFSVDDVWNSLCVPSVHLPTRYGAITVSYLGTPAETGADSCTAVGAAIHSPAPFLWRNKRYEFTSVQMRINEAWDLRPRITRVLDINYLEAAAWRPALHASSCADKVPTVLQESVERELRQVVDSFLAAPAGQEFVARGEAIGAVVAYAALRMATCRFNQSARQFGWMLSCAEEMTASMLRAAVPLLDVLLQSEDQRLRDFGLLRVAAART